MPILLLSGLLAACAGHVADYVGPRSTIITPQLIRYGYTLIQTRCVGETLGTTLSPRRLRDFATAAGAVRQGYYTTSEMTARDLLWVATTQGAQTLAALERANRDCDISAEPAPPPPVPVAPPSPVAQPAAWLNLGAAESGQSIAIDAASIEQRDGTRSAWFRLTNPGESPSANIFRLVVDCPRRTINATERRRLDETGDIAERQDYPDNPLPVEDGTVMQIAWLSLCT
ncbi:MAG: hypothetical protein KF780_04810 [Sphingomonas sp.]|nr:hypothetical protein [Sphingomonas sp.]